ASITEGFSDLFLSKILALYQFQQKLSIDYACAHLPLILNTDEEFWPPANLLSISWYKIMGIRDKILGIYCNMPFLAY
ncbi:MAG: hypothetical protein NT043_03910, partial [Candidatus Bathyarchaeota archaeon]|nr:hypothetical protein [Candidatus Bathyarchaeota archaeon]